MRVRSMCVVLLLPALLAVTGSPALAAGQAPVRLHWVAQISPTRANLADVSCASASECVAVGANATIVRTVNGGRSWKRVSSPYGMAHPSASFVSVRCPQPGVCSVLAPPNVVLHTTDGGRTWGSHTITLSPQLSQLGRLACPTRLICFVTASPSGGTFTWFDHSAAIFKTSDGNKTWRQLSIPPSTPCPGDCGKPTVGYDLQWISCQNAQSCRAGGTTFIGSHEGYASAVLRTDNAGTIWTLVHHSFDPNIATCPTTSICTGVFYQPFTPNVGPYLMRTTNGGSSWTSRDMSTILTSIACTGSSFCELAGPHGKLAMAIGMNLSVQPGPTTRDLTAVACPRVSACYAVGAAGTILARKS